MAKGNDGAVKGEAKNNTVWMSPAGIKAQKHKQLSAVSVKVLHLGGVKELFLSRTLFTKREISESDKEALMDHLRRNGGDLDGDTVMLIHEVYPNLMVYVNLLNNTVKII